SPPSRSVHRTKPRSSSRTMLFQEPRQSILRSRKTKTHPDVTTTLIEQRDLCKFDVLDSFNPPLHIASSLRHKPLAFSNNDLVTFPLKPSTTKHPSQTTVKILTDEPIEPAIAVLTPDPSMTTSSSVSALPPPRLLLHLKNRPLDHLLARPSYQPTSTAPVSLSTNLQASSITAALRTSIL
ncbi:hypothetical protein DXG01_014058, partial [Tephrocybe rancida]